MKLLFDTHAFIWWDSEPERLSDRVRSLCEDPDNVLLLSVASVWEMQIKLQLEKLELRQPLADLIASQQQRNGIRIVSVGLEHVLFLERLPAHHRDPFDRLLVCQAQVEQAALMTSDSSISQYDLAIEW